MKLTHVHIENFRSIRSFDLSLDETTVFIGPNNAGKSAILDAIRIALSRRWGQQGTGFTPDDVHCADENADPRNTPPVRIDLVFDEPSPNAWPSEMVADLEDIMTVRANGLNRVALSVLYSWDESTAAFVPGWQFLNAAGKALPLKRRSVNLSTFYNYPLFF
jgi:putative ATP-dependent endonuclease of OLD family